MRFMVAAELELFAESVRSVLAGREPPAEPALGEWSDDRDDVLAELLAGLGWTGLWEQSELLGPAVAGGLELGRAVAPLHLLDEAALGAPLAAEGRVRNGAGSALAAVALPGWGLALAAVGESAPEPALDSTGTMRAVVTPGEPLPAAEAAARWRAWSTVTLAYLAGLAAASLARTVEHARRREQFGGPLAALPAVQQRLADAATAVDGLELVAWAAAAPEDGDPLPAAPALAWAGAACREVTASAQQVHGAVGFALESGVHRAYRRAKSVQVWADAVCRVTSSGR